MWFLFLTRLINSLLILRALHSLTITRVTTLLQSGYIYLRGNRARTYVRDNAEHVFLCSSFSFSLFLFLFHETPNVTARIYNGSLGKSLRLRCALNFADKVARIFQPLDRIRRPVFQHSSEIAQRKYFTSGIVCDVTGANSIAAAPTFAIYVEFIIFPNVFVHLRREATVWSIPVDPLLASSRISYTDLVISRVKVYLRARRAEKLALKTLTWEIARSSRRASGNS